MSTITKWLSKVVDELGLKNLAQAPRDVKLLCISRFARLCAYGGSALILSSYLSVAGHSETSIGLFMTLTLLGDVCISFILTLFADAVGRKSILAAGALLMTGSGVVFGLTSNYWLLLAAAIFGVISPNGNEIGPFRAIEDSTLAHLTTPETRSDIYAWHALAGTGGAAVGLMGCGWLVRAAEGHGWTELQAYQAVFFYAYSGFGLIKLFFTLLLSGKIEAERQVPKQQDLEGGGSGSKPKPAGLGRLRSFLPNIGKESRAIALKLSILFALDAFASGLIPLSWTTYFFKTKFNIEPEKLGSLFFTTSVISAASVLVASSIAKRFGNVKTMVFTHIPSAIALALIPIPSSLPFAITFLVLRSCTQSMDVAPRSAFLAAILLPNERTAIMGFMNVVKTTSQSAGPLITGVLASHNLFWLAFVAAGSLKVTYDLGMLAVFAGTQSREVKAPEPEYTALVDPGDEEGLDEEDEGVEDGDQRR